MVVGWENEKRGYCRMFPFTVNSRNIVATLWLLYLKSIVVLCAEGNGISRNHDEYFYFYMDFVSRTFILVRVIVIEHS